MGTRRTRFSPAGQNARLDFFSILRQPLSPAVRAPVLLRIRSRRLQNGNHLPVAAGVRPMRNADRVKLPLREYHPGVARLDPGIPRGEFITRIDRISDRRQRLATLPQPCRILRSSNGPTLLLCRPDDRAQSSDRDSQGLSGLGQIWLPRRDPTARR